MIGEIVMAELCLGTAQLGMAYGINNKVGKLSRDAVFEILNIALENGISVIDTASVYGEAEEIIGEFLRINKKSSDIKIVTKQCKSIVGLSRSGIDKTIKNELEQSLKRIGRGYVDGYLLHMYREVENRETIEILQKLKEEGLIRNIGVSIYDVDEAHIAMQYGKINYLQMPCSLFDQRGITSKVFEQAHKLGIKVFTRSAFLQGLLMMKKELIPKGLEPVIPYIETLDQMLMKYNLEKKHALVKFILTEPLIDYMVFGIETKEQLIEIVSEQNKEYLPREFIEEVKEKFSSIPEGLILPINWTK